MDLQIGNFYKINSYPYSNKPVGCTVLYIGLNDRGAYEFFSFEPIFDEDDTGIENLHRFVVLDYNLEEDPSMIEQAPTSTFQRNVIEKYNV